MWACRHQAHWVTRLRWFVRGRLPRGRWQIEPPRPWPSVVGEPLELQAITLFAETNPAYLAWGRKMTSPVGHESV